MSGTQTSEGQVKKVSNLERREPPSSPSVVDVPSLLPLTTQVGETYNRKLDFYREVDFC